jgi:hypothetical protein
MGTVRREDSFLRLWPAPVAQHEQPNHHDLVNGYFGRASGPLR